MAPNFEILNRQYAVEIDEDCFLNLMDSESYATNHGAYQQGAQTLAEKLETLPGVSDVYYNGHYGSFVYFTIDDEFDGDSLKTSIITAIKMHLDWCGRLKKVEHVKKRRAGCLT